MVGSERGVWDWLSTIPLAVWTIVGPAVGTFVTALWIARKDLWKRHDELVIAEANRKRQDQQDIRDEQQRILDWHKAALTDCRARCLELEQNKQTVIAEANKRVTDIEQRYRSQTIETEDERDNWETFARWWYAYSHSLYQLLGDARHLAGNCEAIIRGLGAEHVIETMDIPKLPPSRPRLPSRIEDIGEQT